MGKKSKRKKNPVQQAKKSEKIPGLLYNKLINGKFKAFQFLPVLISLAAGIFFLFTSYKANGYFGFPLDDPWIHLNFAKNMVNYGSFSYFKNELVTWDRLPPFTLYLLPCFLFSLKMNF